MESESSITNKISDSGYSNSYSNSHSCSFSRSGSSKSRHSGSNSSRSSGYGDAASTNPNGSSSGNPSFPPPKRYKDKEHKKKKQKSASTNAVEESTDKAVTVVATLATRVAENEQDAQNIFLMPIGNGEVPGEKVANVPVVINQSLPNLLSSIEPKSPSGENKSMDVQESIPECIKELTALETTVQEANQLTAFLKNLEIENIVDPESKEKEDMLKKERSEEAVSSSEVGFCSVISMYDGAIVYTTPSLTKVLGFPSDMWLGRSFIDFVHPKDRETFSAQVTTGIAVPLVDAHGKCEDVKTYLYVCLRKYKGLKSSGYGVVEKAVSYQAFHLTITMKHITEPTENVFLGNNMGKFLVVVAVPVQSSYKVPRQSNNSTRFGMRHTTTCILNHVDPDVVNSFGFLPQDMLGKSVFDFYHPDDMPFLKEVYKSVMKMCQTDGSVFRSKPYRFLVQNGCFVMIETEWSSFVNPWSRRLEFVISLHRVLQGPMNPDVFAATTDEEYKNIPKEAIRTGKILQTEIIQILNEDLPMPTETAKHEVSKRCKDLSNFMESLISGVNQPNLQLDLPKEPDVSISDRDSVMLGEISPHHDYYDSKSSSETPPSYNQLNYNENLKRFFQSKPKTTHSDESNGVQNNEISEKEGTQAQQCRNNQKCLSPENSGASGSGSGEILSSSSNQNMDSGTTSGNTSNDSYKHPPLTESILVKHNEDMEKLMATKHKQLRHNNNERDRELNKIKQQKYEKARKQANFNESNEHAHGVKRSGSTTRMDGDFQKVPKYQLHNGDINDRHRSRIHANHHQAAMPGNNININNNNGPHQAFTGIKSARGCLNYQPSNVTLWPSFQVPRAPMDPVIQGPSTSASTGTYPSTPLVPVYYFPTVQPRTNFMEPMPRYPVHYMPSVFYNTVFPTPSIICSPVRVVPVPMAPTPTAPLPSPDMRHFGSVKVNSGDNPVAAENNESVGGGDSIMQNDYFYDMPNSVSASIRTERPPSQATSVKAEPGSKMGSIASTSVVNKALSESSRRELGLLSVSPPDGETQRARHFTAKMNEHLNTAPCRTLRKLNEPTSVYRSNTVDESSSCYSSSYSSVLRTDTGSGSNDDTTYKKMNQIDDDIWRNKKNQPMMRKKDPQWLESVAMSPDLIYRYQVAVQNIEEILEADLKKLKEIEQPVMVNDQLNQLYIEMELEGLSKALTLEEGFTSSSSSGEDNDIQRTTFSKYKKKRHSYGSLMMIYEEEAPLPPPEQHNLS